MFEISGGVLKCIIFPIYKINYNLRQNNKMFNATLNNLVTKDACESNKDLDDKPNKFLDLSRRHTSKKIKKSSNFKLTSKFNAKNDD